MTRRFVLAEFIKIEYTTIIQHAITDMRVVVSTHIRSAEEWWYKKPTEYGKSGMRKT